MNRILFVNHRQPVCGVQAMGSRYYRNLAETTRYETFYIDVERQDEFEYWLNELQPQAVVWNFYSGATMPWLSNELIASGKDTYKQLAIYHELPLENKGFDLILHQDPNSTDNFLHWNLPRSIPKYDQVFAEPEVPTFGSFGFGLGGKGFARLVKMVSQEYDDARIHLHIPFAAFGDAQGVSAHAHADQARGEAFKAGIELTIDHDFWEEEKLLDWLANNTCNAFLYDPHHGRGISGTLDYALAVNRPIAITRSFQFKHIWEIDDSFTVENKTLRDVISMGTAHLGRFRAMWSREAFVSSFENALESVGV